MSGALAEYERLKLGEQFAERLYQIALMAHERSLQEARRQQLYLSTIVRPTLPERALYPERLASVLLTFMCAFVLWGIFSMLGATVVDHLT